MTIVQIPLSRIFEKICENKKQKHRQKIVIAGIGQGKTYSSIQIAKTLIEKYERKVIYISHYLVSQSKFVNEFRQYGIEPLVYNHKLTKEEKEKILDAKSGLIVCTVEALITHMNRLLDNCALVIFDEIHLISEETYRDKYKNVRYLIDECKKRGIAFLGITATWNYCVDLGIPVYDTGLKSRINVHRWIWARLRGSYVNAANHKKPKIIGGYIRRILDDIVDLDKYDHVVIYCNNKRIGLKLQNYYPDLKIICSDIKNAYYDYLYNGKRLFEDVINDRLSEYKMLYATEAVCNGLNFHSVRGKVLAIVVVDGTNNILNAVQFVGRFRRADSIDVIQLTVPTKSPKTATVDETWQEIHAYYRRLDVMQYVVTNQYPNVEIGELDLTEVEPKPLKGSNRGTLRFYFNWSREFGRIVTRRFLYLLKQTRRYVNLTTLLFYTLIVTKGKKIKSYKQKYKDKILYALDNKIRDKFLSKIRMIYTRGIDKIAYVYNVKGKTIYELLDKRLYKLINKIKHKIKYNEYKLLCQIIQKQNRSTISLCIELPRFYTFKCTNIPLLVTTNNWLLVQLRQLVLDGV